jgi:hypothetical protein
MPGVNPLLSIELVGFTAAGAEDAEEARRVVHSSSLSAPSANSAPAAVSLSYSRLKDELTQSARAVA